MELNAGRSLLLRALDDNTTETFACKVIAGSEEGEKLEGY